jgi:iron complex transport system substrate-binding protein
MPAGQNARNLERAPRLRIVSLAPSVTSILFSLGAGRELAGVSQWCKHVARVGKRPTVGDCWKLDVAEVLRLCPSHVIGSVPFATEAVEKILKLPFLFLALNPRSLADVEMDIFTLGRLVGKNAEAEKLIGRMRAAFRAVNMAAERARAGKPKLRVYAEAWPKPRISSPPWVAELIELAGGTMCVRSGARVSDAEVLQADPQAILLAWTATGSRSKISSALENPNWRGVAAVKARAVFALRDEWLNTPGPPLMLGARALLRSIAGARGK